MVDIKITGRKVNISDSLRDYVNEKIGDALKVFDIKPMTCDVVLRVRRNPSNPEAAVCEVTVFVRDSVVRVSEESTDMRASIDLAADKVARQLRKYKTKVIDSRKRDAPAIAYEHVEDLSELIDAGPDEVEDDLLVREKVVELKPLTEEQALVETDLLGHDFYVFENATTGLINVIYHRNNGGYGIIKPKIEELDE